MAFIEVNPVINTRRRSHKVRVRFYAKKNAGETILISIPIETGKSVGIDIGDRVSFAYDDSNPKIWLIKKDNNGFKGFKCSTSGRSSTTMKLTISNSFGIIPTEDDFKTREVDSDLYEGGLRIYATDQN